MDNKNVYWQNIRHEILQDSTIAVNDAMIKLIGEIIIRRKIAKLTQEELSDKTGIAQANISNIESLKTMPGLDTFIKILNALNLEIKLVPKGE